MSRRTLLGAVGTAAGAALLEAWGCSNRHNAASGCAQLSGQQIQWLVPFAAGGGFDIYSRLIEPYFEKTLDSEIVVENLPGAGGTVSANKLRRSKADGRTIGILNAPGLLAASMAGDQDAPDPSKDFSILGRVARNRVTWSTATKSKLQTIADVFEEAKKRPIVFGVSEAGSTTFTAIVVASSLLDLNIHLISGHSGSRDSTMAVLRGEADLLASTFESTLDQVDSGDIKPILQVSSESVAKHPALEGVPLLGGAHGVAEARALEINADPSKAIEDAQSLSNLLGAGLLVAAPPNMEQSLLNCLDDRLNEALTTPAFVTAASEARRSLDVARAAQALADIKVAATDALRFGPVIRDAIEKIRKQ